MCRYGPTGSIFSFLNRPAPRRISLGIRGLGRRNSETRCLSHDHSLSEPALGEGNSKHSHVRTSSAVVITMPRTFLLMSTSLSARRWRNPTPSWYITLHSPFGRSPPKEPQGIASGSRYQPIGIRRPRNVHVVSESSSVTVDSHYHLRQS
jgi:hypothetical protein